MGPHDSGGVHCAARTARPPLFRIRDASVVRAGSIILHVDDFTLAEGEHLALLGPNGAGKSTFIKLLTREVMPLYRDAAPVVFRGNERPTLADIKSCFGVVSASMHEQISVHLPVIDIVCGGFFGTLGLPRGVQVDAAMRAASLDALEKLGIADLSARDVLTLSTGQVRRVLVARELVHDPQVLVFDEPCTGLDLRVCIRFAAPCVRLQKKAARSCWSLIILKTSCLLSNASS